MLKRIFALFAFLSPVAFMAMVAGATSHVAIVTLSSLAHDTAPVTSALSAFINLIPAIGGAFVVAAGFMLVLGYLYWIFRSKGRAVTPDDADVSYGGSVRVLYYYNHRINRMKINARNGHFQGKERARFNYDALAGPGGGLAIGRRERG